MWLPFRPPDFDRDAALQFFDHFLKGAENGAQDVPRVRYYIEDGKFGHEMQTAPDWPIPADYQRFTLGGAEGQGVLAMGDNAPAAGRPVPADQFFRGARRYRSAQRDFYQSAVAAGAVAGGNAHSQPDGIRPGEDYVVNAFLEHVSATRSPEVVSRGELLASRRKLGDAPFETAGLPWPTQMEADALPVGADNPVTLKFGLSPIAREMNAGDRLRLAVTLRVNPDDPVLPLTVHFGDTVEGWVDVPFATVDPYADDGDD